MGSLKQLQKDIRKSASPVKANASQWFFKTGKGQYGEGDVFLGLTVPETRKLVKNYHDLSLNDVEKLLHSKYHEERLIAVLVLVEQFRKADEKLQKQIYDYYLANTKYINNWDIVDSSAHKVIGAYLRNKDRSVLQKLAHSESLWERRIAIIATFAFIANHEHKDTLAIADILLGDKHDLIQKAVGWSLREVGKRISQNIEEEFLKTRYTNMPRTMLRYAIERFPEEKRKAYLMGNVK